MNGPDPHHADSPEVLREKGERIGLAGGVLMIPSGEVFDDEQWAALAEGLRRGFRQSGTGGDPSGFAADYAGREDR